MSDAVLSRLETLPRVRMAHLPTAIEEMANLRRTLFADGAGSRGGGPKLLVKRDDNTGIALGGNKVRQLEFYLGDALAREADTVLITSAVQSNYMRTCAAMAARLGLECHLQLEERVPKNDPLYRTNGNVLLDRIAGAHLHSYPDGEDEAGADRSIEDLADRLRLEGRKPYVIHLSPTHPPIGAIGYVAAARELLAQLSESGETVDRIYVGSGSAATHTGLLWGLRAFGSGIPVTGVCVRRPAAQQAARVRANLERLSALLDHDPGFTESDVVATDVTLGPGYGRVTDPVREAIALAGSRDGLFVDPVYTGKVLAGMIDELRAGAMAPDETALFLHTGGQPALFAYGETVLPFSG